MPDLPLLHEALLLIWYFQNGYGLDKWNFYRHGKACLWLLRLPGNLPHEVIADALGRTMARLAAQESQAEYSLHIRAELEADELSAELNDFKLAIEAYQKGASK